MKIEAMGIIRVEPGDVVVLQSPLMMDPEQQAQAIEVTEKMFPEQKVLLLSGGTTLSVHRPEAERPAEVCHACAAAIGGLHEASCKYTGDVMPWHRPVETTEPGQLDARRGRCGMEVAVRALTRSDAGEYFYYGATVACGECVIKGTIADGTLSQLGPRASGWLLAHNCRIYPQAPAAGS